MHAVTRPSCSVSSMYEFNQAKKFLFVLALIGLASSAIGGLALEGYVPAIHYDAITTTILGGIFVLSAAMTYYALKKNTVHKKTSGKEPLRIQRGAYDAEVLHGTVIATTLLIGPPSPIDTGDKVTYGEARASISRSLELASPPKKTQFFAYAQSTVVSRTSSPIRNHQNSTGHKLYGILNQASEDDHIGLFENLSAAFSKKDFSPYALSTAFSPFSGGGAIIYQKLPATYHVVTQAPYRALRIKLDPSAEGACLPTNVTDTHLAVMDVQSFTAIGDFIILGNWDRLEITDKDITTTVRSLGIKKTPPLKILQALLAKVKTYPEEDIYIALARLPLEQ